MPRDETTPHLRVARLPWTTDINPYQRAVYGELAEVGVHCVATAGLTTDWLVAHRARIDVLHVHWHLERLADDAPLDSPPAAWVCGQLDLARALGYAIAWTVHESGRLLLGRDGYEDTVVEALLRLSDVVVTHDEPTARFVVELGQARRHRPVDVVVAPPGSYDSFAAAPAATADPVDAARRLGIAVGDRVVLSLGAQRWDKDLPLLLAAFDDLARADAVLAIVGPIRDDVARSALDGVDPRRVRVLDDWASDEFVAACFALADVAVLARSRDWTSSSLLLATAHATPIVAADLPTNRALVGDHGARWFTPGDSASLTLAIGNALDDPDGGSERVLAAQRHASRTTWSDSALVTATAFRSAVARRSAPSVVAPEPALHV